MRNFNTASSIRDSGRKVFDVLKMKNAQNVYKN